MTQGTIEYESIIPQGTDKGLDLWEAVSYRLFSSTHTAVNLLFLECGKGGWVTDHANLAYVADCWSNWGSVSMWQNTYPRTLACSAIADRTGNHRSACNVKDKVIEWNEQNEAERDGIRGSKSRQCEYEIHKYESGLLNLWKILAALLFMGLVGMNGIVMTFFLYVPGNWARHEISPRQ